MRTLGWRVVCAGLLLSGLLGGAPPPVSRAAPAPQVAPCATLTAPGGRTFPETGQTVRGVFLDHWMQSGGLAQQGFPLSSVLQEVSPLDGHTYAVQYFERAVFECHPDQAGTPFVVLLAQLGTFRYQQQYPQGAPGQRPNGEHPYVFPQTGHTLGGEFRTYWESHGGLAQQGYPLSDEFTEVSPLDGQPYTVQYFERAVFEFHPENVAPYRVLLSQVGTLRYRATYPTPPAPVPTGDPAAPRLLGYVRPGGTPDAAVGLSPSAGNLAAGGNYIFWLDADSPWGDPVLWGYDVVADRQFVVADAPGYKFGIVTDGRTVVWRTLDGPAQAPTPVIHGYSLATGREWPPLAYPGLDERGSYAVDDATLYYVAAAAPNMPGTRLYAYDWPSGQTTRFATAPPSFTILDPIAGAGHIAWSEYNDLQTQQVYRAPTGNPAAATVFAAHAQEGIGYTISGDYLLWWDGSLHVQTLSTGATQQLAWAAGGVYSAVGTQIAWNAATSASAPARAVVGDVRTGVQQTYALPSGGEYGYFVAFIGPHALAYVTGASPYTLYLQPLR